MEYFMVPRRTLVFTEDMRRTQEIPFAVLAQLRAECLANDHERPTVRNIAQLCEPEAAE
jgi:hypothetical protein